MIKKLLFVSAILFLGMQTEAQTILASQNFSSALSPWSATGTDKWVRAIGAISAPSYGKFYFRSPSASNGFAVALADGVSGGLNTELISPAINCSAQAYVGLSFYQWGLLQYQNTVGTVSVSTDNSNWSEVFNIQDAYTGANPELIELDISSYAAYQTTVFIKFTYKNTLSEVFWAIDDIQVLGLQEYDVAVQSVNTPKHTGRLNQPIKATVQNRGGKTIFGLTLGYEVNGTLITETFNNLGMLPFAKQEFTFAAKYPITTVGTFNFQVISFGVSIGADAHLANDTAKATIISLSHLPDKNVLLEESTTAVCGWCPGGTTRINDLMQTEGDYVIPVAMHAGFGTDAMTIDEHTTLSDAFGSGAPYAAIDRILFSEEDGINVGLPSLASNYNIWKAKVQLQKNYLQPVSIIASNTFTPGTRRLNINVNAVFYGAVSGDFRINCYVVEDSVVGTGSGYNQVSYYNSSPADTTLNPWFNKGNPMVGFIHRNVVRSFLGGAWGNDSIIPDRTEDGGFYTKDYSVVVPAGWNVAHLKLVALVSNYSSDYSSGLNEVLNSVEMSLNGQVSNNAPQAVYATGIDELKALDKMNIAPNPARNMVTVSYQLESEKKISYEVYNMMGQMVISIPEARMPQGTINTTLNTENMESGIYLVSIKENGASLHTAKFIIEK
ncbi:MAG: Omp28-related outer membrane protein [Bacteroidetes bacterium]|nr:Omp28-related outer membrane protein [Bacteroidota bacterium]